MSLDNVKNSFIKHLTDKFTKNAFGKFNPEDMSMFEYLSEFNTFLSQDANLDVSLFSFSTDEIKRIAHDISVFNSDGEVKDKVATGYFEGDKQQVGRIEMYSELFKDENVIGMFDTDGDSQLSEDEMAAAMQNIAAIDGVDGEVSLKDFIGLQSYVQDFIANHPDLSGEELQQALLESINSLDGDSSKLSAQDFQKLGEKLEEMGILGGTQEMTPEELVQQFQDTFSSVPEAYSSGNFQNASLNTHASNYTGPSGELKSHEMRDAVISTDGEIANLENQIVEQNNLKLEAANASSAYFAENKYDEKVSSLNSIISDINTYNSTLTSSKSELHETQYDLNAAKVELENLQDPVVFTEYSDEINEFIQRLDEVLLKGLDENEKDPTPYYAKKENTLIYRIMEYRDNYIYWILDFDIPFTNNLSERNLRGIKSKMKVSGQFQNVDRARDYANIRSYIETCRLYGKNEYDALSKLVEGKPYTFAELIDEKK